MNQPKKPNIEAVAAYENAQLVARDLLSAVRELLDAMPRPDGTRPSTGGTLAI